MLRTTASRVLASRPVSSGFVATAQRVSIRRAPTIQRSLSFLSWRRKRDPTLPVYFPKPVTHGRRAPLRKIRYALLSIAIYYTLWQVYMTVVLDPLLDWAENEWESMSEKERQELEQEADDEDADPILFLPFPFTTKEVKQLPYKGSDPEWAAFVKVNKDPKLQKQMKVKLAEGIRTAFDKNPVAVRLLGGNPTKVKKIWLDILFPARPPPKHYVSGLFIDWDGLFWGDRSIDSMAAHKLNAVVYPKAVALATWTFVNVLLQNTKETFSKALGIGASPPQRETTWQSVILERGKEHRPGALGTGNSSPPQVIQPNPAGHQLPASLSQRPSSSGQLPESETLDLMGMLRRSVGLDPTPSASSTGILMAFQAASMTLTKNWKPTQQPVTRGCIRVDGLVEIQGPSAIMVLYVLGWYDPQTSKYVNVQTKIKHVTQMRQVPLGGK